VSTSPMEPSLTMVKDVMTSPCVFVHSDASAKDVSILLLRRGVRSAIVYVGSGDVLIFSTSCSF
jgi:CBS domain-containing protein